MPSREFFTRWMRPLDELGANLEVECQRCPASALHGSGEFVAGLAGGRNVDAIEANDLAAESHRPVVLHEGVAGKLILGARGKRVARETNPVLMVSQWFRITRCPSGGR